jgi:fluoroquinolone resistance protein
LTNSTLGEQDVRSTNLEGVKLDAYQVSELMGRLGIIVIN